MFSRVAKFLGAYRSSGMVLLYHRVAPVASDPQLLVVSPVRFEEQMVFLRRNAVPMPLVDMVRAAEEGSLPRRAVAVTFDDGYADNYEYAKPILEGTGVPATVFVVSGAVTDRSEFWWDTLERALLLQNGSVTLQLEFAGERRNWVLTGDPSAFPEWNVLEPFDPTPWHTAYRELMPLIKMLDPDVRAEVIASVQAQTGAIAGVQEDRRPMTSSELRDLVDGGLIDVGAHTVSHPQLSMLTVDAQSDQVLRSRQVLEAMVGRPVKTFAYPYGTTADYTVQTVDVVRNAGFSLACSNFPGRLVNRRVDSFEVPRYLVRECSLPVFQASFEARIRGAE